MSGDLFLVFGHALHTIPHLLISASDCSGFINPWAEKIRLFNSALLILNAG
jgi:hypothetical protein